MMAREGGDAVPDADDGQRSSCADATNLFVCAAESATTGAVWPIRYFCPHSCTTTRDETA